jgi:hypothetical protein
MIQQFEQLQQGQRWSGLAGLLPRERIDTTAKKFSRLALSKLELLAHADDESGVNNGRIHLLVERLHLVHDPTGLGHTFDRLIAGLAKISGYSRNHGGFAFE